MSIRKKTVLFAGLAATLLVLAPPRPPPRLRACRRLGPPPGYIIKTASGISLPNMAEEGGEAFCPSGTVLLSGGAYIASHSVMTGINSSFPLSNRIWEADANNFSGAATTFNVYAVCATQPQGYEQLTSSLLSNPAGDQDSATVNCPAGEKVLSGSVSAGVRSRSA